VQPLETYGGVFLRRKGFQRKLFDGIFLVLYFSWKKIKFLYAFSGCRLKMHIGFLSRKLFLGDAFGNILDVIVALACFR
jgi:hypothetical protein